MTREAQRLGEALLAYVSAVDRFHEQRRLRPLDTAELCRLGAEVDSAAQKVPTQVCRAIVSQLADKTTVSLTLD